MAQAIRLWTILHSVTMDERYCESATKASSYLMSMQCMDSDQMTLGGFYLIEFDMKLVKYKLRRLYSWATMFAIHALSLIRESHLRKIENTELW
jgi:hypothetical protein